MVIIETVSCQNQEMQMVFLFPKKDYRENEWKIGKACFEVGVAIELQCSALDIINKLICIILCALKVMFCVC